MAHYLIHKSLDEQAAAAKLVETTDGFAEKAAGSLPADSEPSDASAQTAGGGDAACDGPEYEATADCAAVEAVAGGVRSHSDCWNRCQTRPCDF